MAINGQSDISPICRDALTGSISLNLGLLSHVADIITLAKFCDNRFKGLGVLIPQILPFSIGIAGRPYNSVIPCYTVIPRTLQHK